MELAKLLVSWRTGPAGPVIRSNFGRGRPRSRQVVPLQWGSCALATARPAAPPRLTSPRRPRRSSATPRISAPPSRRRPLRRPARPVRGSRSRRLTPRRQLPESGQGPARAGTFPRGPESPGWMRRIRYTAISAPRPERRRHGQARPRLGPPLRLGPPPRLGSPPWLRPPPGSGPGPGSRGWAAVAVSAGGTSPETQTSVGSRSPG